MYSISALQNLSPLIKKSQTKDWNLIIRHHAKLRNDHAILCTYTQMESLGIYPDKITLPLIIKSCSRLNAIERAKKIHSKIAGTNLIEDTRVGTSLIDFYCKSGYLEDARRVFDEMVDRDVVAWNALVNGYVGLGECEEALYLFREMEKEGFRANSRTVVALLSACGELLELELGREVHGYCLRSGMLDKEPHVGTALIGFYSRFDTRTSHLVFDKMLVRNVVSWNALGNAYFDAGEYLTALQLFEEMLRCGIGFDHVTLLTAIQACSELGFLEMGLQFHQMVVKCGFSDDLFVVSALINMYSQNGSLWHASDIFEYSVVRDVALWNSMLSAFAEFGCHDKAMSLFSEMRESGFIADETTIVLMLSLCEELTDGLRMGRSLHAYVIKRGIVIDVSLGNALLSLYQQSSCVEAVQKVFSKMRSIDVVSWNVLIMALASKQSRTEAWELFHEMQESDFRPNSHTLIAILDTCDDESCLKIGGSLHCYAVKSAIPINISLNTALIEMYMNCGDEEAARKMFNKCPGKDLASWNAVIARYIKLNQAHKALLLFNRMVSEVEPNSVTILNILSTCTHLANLPLGQCLHAYIQRREYNIGFDVSLSNALVSMYARCGSLKNAEKIFNLMPRRDLISWNTMITGYSMHGCGLDAKLTFLQMLENGFKPNAITFISLLSACSHSGMLEEGLQLFQSMVYEFQISPELAHYGCVVDLLGRQGYLNKAREFVNLMPVEPDASVWRALLNTCRYYPDIKLAKTTFKKLLILEPANAGNYVLLSNIHAAKGHWLEVKRIRKWLQEQGLKKPPGISWIVVRSQVHSFTAGGCSHSQSDSIFSCLGSLLCLIKEAGYVPDFSWVLHDEDA